jgi:hypothetical protein
MVGAASGPQVTPGQDRLDELVKLCQSVTDLVNERGAERNPHTARGESAASS